LRSSSWRTEAEGGRSCTADEQDAVGFSAEGARHRVPALGQPLAFGSEADAALPLSTSPVMILEQESHTEWKNWPKWIFRTMRWVPGSGAERPRKVAPSWEPLSSLGRPNAPEPAPRRAAAPAASHAWRKPETEGPVGVLGTRTAILCMLSAIYRVWQVHRAGTCCFCC